MIEQLVEAKQVNTLKILVSLILLASSCASPPPAYYQGATPSEKCHLVLDGICKQNSRCMRVTGQEDRCLEFMMGRVPFPFSYKGTRTNFRAECDKVTYVGPGLDRCLSELRSSCMVRDSCQNLEMRQ